MFSLIVKKVITLSKVDYSPDARSVYFDDVIEKTYTEIRKFYNNVVGYGGSHNLSKENISKMCKLISQGENVWEIGFGVPYLAFSLAAVSGTTVHATDIDNGKIGNN